MIKPKPNTIINGNTKDEIIIKHVISFSNMEYAWRIIDQKGREMYIYTHDNDKWYVTAPDIKAYGLIKK